MRGKEGEKRERRRMGGWGWKGKEDMYDSNQCECRKCEKKSLAQRK